MNDSSPSTKTRPVTLLALCLVLWLLAAALVIYSVWLLLQPGTTTLAILTLAVALLMFFAALGLYHLKRWGVALFGILGLAGSINHISNAVLRFAALNFADTGAAISSIISVLGAFMIPFGIIYLMLVLWRQAR
jgi:hypothetical protein